MRVGRGGLVPETPEETPRPLAPGELLRYQRNYVRIRVEWMGESAVEFETVMRLDGSKLVQSERTDGVVRCTTFRHEGDAQPAETISVMQRMQAALETLVALAKPDTIEPDHPLDRFEGISADPTDYLPVSGEEKRHEQAEEGAEEARREEDDQG